MTQHPQASPGDGASTRRRLLGIFASLRAAGSGAPTGFRAPAPSRRAGRVPALLGGLAAALALSAALAASSASAAEPPTLTIDPVSAPTITTAHLSGEVQVPVANNPTYWCFEYTPEGSASWNSFCFSGPVQPGEALPVEADLTNLSANQPYEVRLAAVDFAEFNEGSEALSAVRSFTTDPAPQTPAVELEPATASYVSAQIQGSVDPEGGNLDSPGNPVPIHWAIELSESGEPGTFSPVEQGDITGPQAEESAPIPVSADPGLPPNTSFHYRLSATYAGQQVLTPDATFTTKEVQKPQLTIADASTITATTAHFSGTVSLATNDPAFNSSCVFEYATAEDFSGAVALPCEPGAGTILASEAQPVAVSADLTSLIPGTVYHLRLTATNAGGTEQIIAPDTFTTEAVEPSIDATYSTAPSETEVMLQAKVNPGGAQTSFHFEYLTAQKYEEDGSSFGAGTVKAPEPDGPVGSDAEDHTVEAAIEGLQPDTAYRYRVVASNEKSPAGGTLGPDKAFTTPSDLSGACPANEQLRRENNSTTLPDCRAYELVSPIEKGGLSFLPNLAVTDAGGEHVIVDGGSKNALLSNAVSWMLQTRTPSGWSGVQIGPAAAADANFQEQANVSLNAVSEDFTRFAFQIRMALDPRDTTHGLAEYIRSGPTGPFAWATGPPAPNLPVSEPGECENGLEPTECTTNRAVFAGSSSDLQDLVWGQYHPLLAPPASLPGSPPDIHEHGYEVYESVAGFPQLTGLVPAGSALQCGPSQGSCIVPPCGAAMGNQSAGGGFAPVQGSVSSDGSQVIFTSPDPSTEGTEGCAPPEIYVREDGRRTLQASASLKAGSDPNGPRQKMYAGSSEEDGRISTVFFTSHEELTEDANTGGADEGNDLYAYTLPTGSQPGNLVDLTPENNTPGPSESVEVTFLGSSKNGRLVYFTASSALTTEPNDQGQIAQPGSKNLYLYEAANAHTTFIASGDGLAPPHIGLFYGFNPTARRITSQATPDGQHFVFVSHERLTEYDNFGPECQGFAENGLPVREPGQCAEVYLYTAAQDSLVCVSCNPTGAPPAGSARLPEAFKEEYSPDALEPGTLQAPRAISDDGSRVFFSSPDRLTGEAPPPTTTKGPQAPIAINWEFEPNVYEYQDGGVHLIAPAAVLLNSTPTGSDVLFDTFGRLTPSDDDGSPDVYDARVDGGFPAPAPPGCSGASCQGAPSGAPAAAAVGSATLTGRGNVSSSKSRKLSRALKACRKKQSKRARKRCESQAKQRFGNRASKTASKSRGGK